MSKHESWMTRWYWRQVGGTLIEEFPAVRRTQHCGQRLLDGVIVVGGEHRIVRHAEVDLTGRDIISVQTKASRLGINVIGQALFSLHLLERFNPRSIKSVALCSQNDSVLAPIFEQYPNMEVVVCPKENRPENEDVHTNG
ncbi:MAG: hypothetical protein ACI8P0_002053 [Planctomycetaceae bacterium]|jgi:hypothetical protein